MAQVPLAMSQAALTAAKAVVNGRSGFRTLGGAPACSGVCQAHRVRQKSRFPPGGKTETSIESRNEQKREVPSMWGGTTW